nr:acyltransferase [Bradyrhizobium canariense]
MRQEAGPQSASDNIASFRKTIGGVVVRIRTKHASCSQNRQSKAIGAGRYSALDGARGVAALTVLLLHSAARLQASDGSWAEILLKAVFTLGHASVIFFFVLSGFVLSIRFFGRARVPYGWFQLGRFVRLYPCFLVAIIVAAAVMLCTKDFPGREDARAFSVVWLSPLTLSSFVRQLLLLGVTPADIDLDGPVWSLVYELRAGFFIPLLCWGLTRYPIRYSVAALVGLIAASSVGLAWRGVPNPPFTGLTVIGSVLATLHYLCVFYIGCLLSCLYHKQVDTPSRWLGLLTAPHIMAIGALALLAAGTALHSDITLGLFAGCVILTILRSDVAHRILTLPPVAHLGRISYSLYLIHFPLVLGILRVTGGQISDGYFFLLSVLISGGAATAVYWLFEIPSIRWSHAVSRGSSAAGMREHSKQISSPTRHSLEAVGADPSALTVLPRQRRP